MSTYAIGDIQGCYDELMRLLDQIQFDQDDQLWVAGDLINRGKDSLKVLRFLKSLPKEPIIVLGNHDFHFMAIAKGYQKPRPQDTLDELLKAEDRDELLQWLRGKKLLHLDREKGYLMVHAGISPLWNLEEAISYSDEIYKVMQSDQFPPLLAHLYGNEPAIWQDDLKGFDRYRCMINIFARIRYCFADGRMNFEEKGTLNERPENLYPWYLVPNRKKIDFKIIFGHWAALNGESGVPKIFAVDTGCSWGHALTAFRLEDQRRFIEPVLRRE